MFYLDLNTSGRKSSAANNDSFHIAFGSKMSGVPSASSAGRRSTKEVRMVKNAFDNRIIFDLYFNTRSIVLQDLVVHVYGHCNFSFVRNKQLSQIIEKLYHVFLTPH